MSEIQCSSVTSSRRNRRKPQKTAERINHDSEVENASGDKAAILKLVKRNLQKMCLNKNSLQITELEETPLQNNRLSGYSETAEKVARIDFSTTILSGYDYDRSRSTKELLRKAILERRKPHIAMEEIRIDFKQKIWRPW